MEKRTRIPAWILRDATFSQYAGETPDSRRGRKIDFGVILILFFSGSFFKGHPLKSP